MNKLNENIFHLYNRWKEGYVRKETSLEEKIKPMKEWAEKAFNEDDFDKMDFDPNGITVNGMLLISSSELTDEIPYPFVECESFTLLPSTSIKSLKNCPKYVEEFDCSACASLTSLEGAPEKSKITFSCNDCISLTSLVGAPKEIGYYTDKYTGKSFHFFGDFYCAGCKRLKTLEGAPEKIGTFSCAGCNGLKTLEGAPKDVQQNFNCAGCDSLESLIGAPKTVGGDFDCSGCKNLSSIEDLPELIEGKLIIDSRFEGKIPKNVTIEGETEWK